MKANVSILSHVKSILLNEWDPIGVRGVPQARDEYDSYAAELAAMVRRGASVQTLAHRLIAIETGIMGLQPHPNRAELVAERLKRLAQP